MDTHTYKKTRILPCLDDSETHTALWLLSCAPTHLLKACLHTNLIHRQSAQSAKADACSPQTPKMLTVVQEKEEDKKIRGRKEESRG